MEEYVETAVLQIWEKQNRLIEEYNDVLATLDEHENYSVTYEEKSDLLTDNPAEVVKHFLGEDTLSEESEEGVLGDIGVEANSFGHPVTIWLTPVYEDDEVRFSVQYDRETGTDKQVEDLVKRLQNDFESYEIEPQSSNQLTV